MITAHEHQRWSATARKKSQVTNNPIVLQAHFSGVGDLRIVGTSLCCRVAFSRLNCLGCRGCCMCCCLAFGDLMQLVVNNCFNRPCLVYNPQGMIAWHATRCSRCICTNHGTLQVTPITHRMPWIRVTSHERWSRQMAKATQLAHKKHAQKLVRSAAPMPHAGWALATACQNALRSRLLHRELEHNVLVGDLLVHRREGVELGLHVDLRRRHSQVGTHQVTSSTRATSKNLVTDV